MGEERAKDEGLWRRFRGSLGKTRSQIAEGIGNLILGERIIDDDVLLELETSLLVTDVGVEATDMVMDALKARVSRKELANTAALHAALGSELRDIAAPLARPFEVGGSRPFVILMVGVNGAGKTTTIGKLAKRLEGQGLSVMLAAGDTFRAAAVEQLQEWGARNNVPVVAQHQGADSASVIYDAIDSARAQNVDVVIADTAGRLQAKSGLMDELTKVKRVIGRLDDTAPHECLLVLDATVGQNALSQVEEFDRAIGLSGLVVTKLDGSAKAGVLFAIAVARGADLPVYFVGLGEGIDDLQPFEPDTYVDALLSE